MDSQVKQFVKEKMAQLQSGEIPRRRPGRPRIHPEGYLYDRKDPNVDPQLSAARAAAGRKGRAVVDARNRKEEWRNKQGAIKQAELEQEVAKLAAELNSCTYRDGTLDRQDTYDFVGFCISVIQEAIWNRKWHDFEDVLERVPNHHPTKEYVNFIGADDVPDDLCRCFPEEYCRSIIKYAKTLPLTDSVSKFAIKALEHFIEWQSVNRVRADADFAAAVDEVKLALPKFKDGSIYKGPLAAEDDIRLAPRTPGPTFEEQIAERAKWEPESQIVQRESLKQKREREDRELEASILRNKAIEDAAKLEQQQRSLLGPTYDVIQEALHPSVFDFTPRKR